MQLIIGGDSTFARWYCKLHPQSVTPISRSECDITKEAELVTLFKKYHPSTIINAAAITDIEACEMNPKKCFEVNIHGVHLLNEACLQNNAQLIHLSSDYAIKPVNTYGLSKYLSEQIVDKTFQVMRTNFYSENTYIIQKLLQKDHISCFSNVYFNPISIVGLIKHMNTLTEAGTHTVLTNKKISYYDFAKLVCAELNIEYPQYVQPTMYKNTVKKAQRPLNSYIKPDINEDITNDLGAFIEFLQT